MLASSATESRLPEFGHLRRLCCFFFALTLRYCLSRFGYEPTPVTFYFCYLPGPILSVSKYSKFVLIFLCFQTFSFTLVEIVRKVILIYCRLSEINCEVMFPATAITNYVFFADNSLWVQPTTSVMTFIFLD